MKLSRVLSTRNIDPVRLLADGNLIARTSQGQRTNFGLDLSGKRSQIIFEADSVRIELLSELRARDPCFALFQPLHNACALCCIP